jgi:hypothetical protein
MLDCEWACLRSHAADLGRAVSDGNTAIGPSAFPEAW